MSINLKLATLLSLYAAFRQVFAFSATDEHQFFISGSTSGSHQATFSTQIPFFVCFDKINVAFLGRTSVPFFKDPHIELTGGLGAAYSLSIKEVIGAHILLNRHREHLTSYLLGIGGMYNRIAMQLAIRSFNGSHLHLVYRNLLEASVSGNYALLSNITLHAHLQIIKKCLTTPIEQQTTLVGNVGADFTVRKRILIRSRLAIQNPKRIAVTIGFGMKIASILKKTESSYIPLASIFLDQLNGLANPLVGASSALEKKNNSASESPSGHRLNAPLLSEKKVYELEKSLENTQQPVKTKTNSDFVENWNHTSGYSSLDLQAQSSADPVGEEHDPMLSSIKSFKSQPTISAVVRQQESGLQTLSVSAHRQPTAHSMEKYGSTLGSIADSKRQPSIAIVAHHQILSLRTPSALESRSGLNLISEGQPSIAIVAHHQILSLRTPSALESRSDLNLISEGQPSIAIIAHHQILSLRTPSALEPRSGLNLISEGQITSTAIAAYHQIFSIQTPLASVHQVDNQLKTGENNKLQAANPLYFRLVFKRRQLPEKIYWTVITRNTPNIARHCSFLSRINYLFLTPCTPRSEPRKRLDEKTVGFAHVLSSGDNAPQVLSTPSTPRLRHRRLDEKTVGLAHVLSSDDNAPQVLSTPSTPRLGHRRLDEEAAGIPSVSLASRGQNSFFPSPETGFQLNPTLIGGETNSARSLKLKASPKQRVRLRYEKSAPLGNARAFGMIEPSRGYHAVLNDVKRQLTGFFPF